MTEVLTGPSLPRTRATERPTLSDAQRRPRKFRPDIEGLRAISVVLVVLYHAHLGVRGGFVGVDVFFVISGFLITGQLLSSISKDGIRSLPIFYSRRIKRLLPASVVVVVATVVVARVWAAVQAPDVARDGLFTTFYGLNYRLAAEGTQYLHAGDAVSPLQHFWSLAVEEQFYVGWPLLIITIVALARRWRTPILAGALALLIAASYDWSMTLTPRNAPWAYFSLQTRAWELALGALVAVGAGACVKIPRLVAEFGAALGLVAVLGSAFVFSDATRYPGTLAAVPVVGAALVIACGVATRRRVERFLGEPLMQCVGRISYSWYLWHWPMLILAPSIVAHELGWQARVVVVWLSMIAAIASYFFVEDPGRRLQLQPVRWIGAGAAMSAAVASVAVLLIANPPTIVGKGTAVTLASGTIGVTPTQAGGAAATNDAFLKEVTSVVATGLKTTAAPSNLTPNPARAANNNPDPSRNGCHLDFLVVEQGPCVFGDPNGTHTVVLFGDSHMEQWEPAFSKAGAELHWKVINWTKAACPPADLRVMAVTLNRPYTECDTWRQQTIARIAALNPDVIVVGESENAKGVNDIKPEDWTSSTVRTLDALKAKTTSRITFMGDNPVPRQLVPTCVANHLSDVRSCQTDVAHEYTYPDRHKAVRPAITKAGYDYIDPQPWVCAPDGCPPIIGNFLVNRDATHISRDYAEFLTPLIAPVLQPGPRR